MTETSAPDRRKGRGGGPSGSEIRIFRDGQPKRHFTDGARWSDEAGEVFLNALAASSNVTASAEAGFSPTAVYRRRRLDTGFAAKWEAAKAQGYARLELAMVHAAIATMEGTALDADNPITQMSASDVLNLLRLHAGRNANGSTIAAARARSRSCATASCARSRRSAA